MFGIELGQYFPEGRISRDYLGESAVALMMAAPFTSFFFILMLKYVFSMEHQVGTAVDSVSFEMNRFLLILLLLQLLDNLRKFADVIPGGQNTLILLLGILFIILMSQCFIFWGNTMLGMYALSRWMKFINGRY
jgi:hypothetical protein